MVDITDYEAQDNHHTHIAVIDGDRVLLDIPEDNELLAEIMQSSLDDDIHIEEVIEPDSCMPHIHTTGCPPEKGTSFLYVIMKTLYNHSHPVVALSDPEDEEATILCAPYAQVNKEMMAEIIETFNIICRQANIECDITPIRTIPLTWPYTCYKEGSEIDSEVALGPDGPLSLSKRTTTVSSTNRVKTTATKARKDALINSILLHTQAPVRSDMEKAIDLVPMISPDRSRDISMFLTAGRCMHRIFRGGDDGLDLWQDMTVPEMKSDCAEYWPTLQSTGTFYTVRTIQMWAKEDSPEQYEEWNFTSVRVAIEASVAASGGDTDIASVAYALNPSLFICDGEEPREAQFFKFNGTYYQPCGTFQVQDYLEQSVIPEYQSFSKDLAQLADSNPDNNFKDMIQAKIDKCLKIIMSLKKVSYQKSITEILMRRYNVPHFDDIRDSSLYLTAFEDCVLDLSPEMLKRVHDTGDINGCFRPGLPEDYITCSTGYPMKDIIETYTWDHPRVKDVTKAYGDFETCQEKQVMIRRQIASALYASNIRKRKLIITGPTNNGKSMLCSWWAKAMGPTYFPMNVGSNLLYSMDANPNGPTPSMDPVRFSRVLMQSEITDQHIMNEGLVKRLTGKVDTIASRAMYARKMKSFIPKCTPVTVCNTFPAINGNSSALRTRLLVYKMTSSFISQTDPEWDQIKDLDEEERDIFMAENSWFYANQEFDAIINRSYQAFMWVMIQDYIKYAATDGIVAPVELPKSVQADTVAYFIQSNIYLQFIRQACERVPGGGGVTTYAMYNAYKQWYSDNVSRFGHASYAKFTEELLALKMAPVNDMYNGLIIKASVSR